MNRPLLREKELDSVSSREAPFQRIAIVGLGLIGGSWALALRRAGVQARRIGCDRPEVLKSALASGAVDEGFGSLAAAVQGADLIILATPVGIILEQLSELKGLASPRALITDAGSTKRLICQRAQEALAEEPLFLGGHPLAGKERSGYREAEASLFAGARYVITPFAAAHLTDERVKAFASLLKQIGARPFVVEAEVHDRAAAFLSHLPQLVSSGLAGMVAEQTMGERLPLELAASGFRDMTRLAESPFDLWRDICLTNMENLQAALDLLIDRLRGIRDRLGDPALERDFRQAVRLRDRLREIE